MGRVIVVGSVNVDLVVASEHLPGPGETVIGGRFSQHHGGKGGNQAVAAARLGAAVRFIGAVGDDDFGRQAQAALEAEGIDLAGLRTVSAATGVALILVDAAGENSIAVASGANSVVTPDDVRTALAMARIEPGDVVLVGHEIPTETAVAALTAGRAVGAMTILNPAPANGLTVAALTVADVITPNEGELAILGRLAGAGPADDVASTVERLRATGLGAAWVVSLGADGAFLASADGAWSVPALAVEAMDTVGAGDTLNGALATGLADGLSLVEAANRAIAAASLAVAREGAREGMPTALELEAVLGGSTPG